MKSIVYLNAGFATVAMFRLFPRFIFAFSTKEFFHVSYIVYCNGQDFFFRFSSFNSVFISPSLKLATLNCDAVRDSPGVAIMASKSHFSNPCS